MKKTKGEVIVESNSIRFVFKRSVFGTIELLVMKNGAELFSFGTKSALKQVDCEFLVDTKKKQISFIYDADKLKKRQKRKMSIDLEDEKKIEEATESLNKFNYSVHKLS